MTCVEEGLQDKYGTNIKSIIQAERPSSYIKSLLKTIFVVLGTRSR